MIAALVVAEPLSSEEQRGGRDELGRFLPGSHPTGGRAIGGRAAYLRELDAIMNEPEVREARCKAVREAMIADPLGALMKYVYPLLPRNLTLDADGVDAMKGLYLSVCAAVEGRRLEQSGKAGGGEVPSEVPSV